jgi:hypothetical protein
MKLLIPICFIFIALFSTIRAQEPELIGTWKIIEFTMNSDDYNNTMDEEN